MNAPKERKIKLQEQLTSYTKMSQNFLLPTKKTAILGVSVATMATGGASLDAGIVTIVSGLSLEANGGAISINMNDDANIDFFINDGAGSSFQFQNAIANPDLDDNNRIYGLRNSSGTATYANRFENSVNITANQGGTFDNLTPNNSAFRNRKHYLQFLGLTYPNSEFKNVRGFVGVRFDINGSDHLGFIDLEGTTTGMIIHGWAYEDIAISSGGTSILTQAIPEVSQVGGVALLAAGAVGITEMRRRKIKANRQT